MRLVRFASVLALLMVLPGTARADYWTITGLAGYNFGGSIDIAEEQTFDLDTVDDFSPGAAIGFTNWRNYSFEVAWMFRPQKVEGGRRDIQETREGKLNTHEFMGNFLFAPAYAEGPVIPFLLFGLGLSVFDPEGDFDSETRFAWAIGGGAKIWTASEKIGFRIQGRYHSTYINSDPDGVWCDPWYCYTVEDANWLDEFDAHAGIMVKFGER